METLMARIYSVKRDGLDAYELRMEGFGMYVAKDKLDHMFSGLTDAITAIDRMRVHNGTPAEVVVAQPVTEVRKKKRTYTKRNKKYWSQYE